MDIASRIKIFMDYLGIPSSQFADTCGIPRPSLSQLLNGRNKKVSDEVIGKIHDAYPSLSVLWLMFGEGSMVPDANNEISEPENDLFSASQAAE
ncbi:helix-turn-helix domain-containing protein, partial [uncultured Muribaculum sp.]